MGLTNSQYDGIMREYDSRQLYNRHLMEDRISEAYARDARLKEIDDSIAMYSVAAAKKLLSGDKNAVAELKATLADARTMRESLLDSLGYSRDYFEPVYTCPDCKDTGYIGGKKCHCLEQAIIDTVYSQSNIRAVLERENFNHLSYEYFSSQEDLDNFKNIVSECHRFIDEFDEKHGNLLFMGEVGTGKTFLSNCIAKDLLDKGKSVVYFSSSKLFEVLGQGFFEKKADAIAANQNIFDCDLLIIDDLGTELANSFSVSQLFLCINERILREKSTIISSNLSLSNMADVYSERIVSRLSSYYSILKLSGDDIRIKRKLQAM